MNAHTPFDANQDWSNPYCQNSSNDQIVDALLGNAYHVVRTVYCNLGNLKLLYDLLNQYGMVLGVQSEAELKTLTTAAKYARIYGFSRAGDRQVTDYLYVEGDRTGILPDDTTATGSWITVATSDSSGGGTSSGNGAYIPWVYNNGSATGGETSINVPDGTVGVPFIIINGDMQYVGRGFEFNVDNLSVTLAQPLEEGDEVVFLLTGVPAVPDNPNVNDWVQINWLYNNGAAVGGEQVIAIPYTFQSVPAVYKNGLRLAKNLATNSYLIDSDNQSIILTEPLTTNDRVIIQIGGEARVVEVSDRTVQEIARSLNVSDSAVILSTNTTSTLNGKKFLYSVEQQKVYELPILPSNIYISAVSGQTLTYNPGEIQVTLKEVITGKVLQSRIEDPDGAVKYPELQIARWKDVGDVRAWGAKGDNVTDDTQAFLDAIAYCKANRKTVYVPIGKYRTSSELDFTDDVSIICEPGVVFQNTNTSNKTFPCVTISGGAKRAVLGTIDGYKEGIVVKRNTKNVLFNVISDCTSSVVFRAERVAGSDLSTLDNIVTGTQIGRCENGIVFEQNARLTQQGNEVHVNFCSGTKHCVVFDDLGTHTQSSNWDSNFVEFQAIDPFHIPGASIVYNKTAYSVLANTVNVVKWAGGWTDASEMSLLRGGNFDACEFNFSLAQSLTPDMVCEPSQRASFGTCQARSTRHGNTATASPPVCVDQANIATFNGGVPLHQGVFKVRVAAPELAPGAQYIAYFTHAFCVSANSSKFTVRQVRTGGNGISVQLRDSASTALGAVRVIVVNPTSTTMAAGNIDIVITCVG